MTRSLFSMLILFGMGSCQHSTRALTIPEQREIIQSIKQTLDNYYEDIRVSGLTAEFNYLDHSPDFFWVPPGYTSSISYDSVVSVLKQNAPLFRSVYNSFDTIRIIPLKSDLATYTARINSTMTDTAGKQSTLTLLETGVLIKRKTGWKLLCGQTSIIDQ